MATTNRDVGAMVSRKQFRIDLYYRLNVFQAIPTVPALGSDSCFGLGRRRLNLATCQALGCAMFTSWLTSPRPDMESN